jgi:hypothetical protein
MTRIAVPADRPVPRAAWIIVPPTFLATADEMIE